MFETVYGGDAARELFASLEGKVLLVTDETLLGKYRDLFPSHFLIECLQGIEVAYMQSRSAALPDFDTVVGFGGGVCIDGAKYFAWQHAKPCYLVPTAISVDACYSYAIALRRGNVVFYEGEVLPVQIVVDTGIIRAAPKQLNLSGVGDVLSCYTALFDWKLLDAAGETPPVDTRQYEGAQHLLAEMFAGAAEIRDMTNAGIKLLMDAYKWVGIEGYRSRHCHFEEGCEHYLAYTIESVCGKRLLHGQLVCMCVYIMSKLQGEGRQAQVAEFMKNIGLSIHPQAVGLLEEEVIAALERVHDFARENKLPYSVLEEKAVTPAFIQEALEELRAL